VPVLRGVKRGFSSLAGPVATSFELVESIPPPWPRVFNLWNRYRGHGQVKNLPPRGMRGHGQVENLPPRGMRGHGQVENLPPRGMRGQGQVKNLPPRGQHIRCRTGLAASLFHHRAAIAIAAVSTRRMWCPSETRTTPARSATPSSSSVKPPSGPTKAMISVAVGGTMSVVSGFPPG